MKTMLVTRVPTRHGGLDVEVSMTAFHAPNAPID